jgi:hypothetical protein
VLSDVGGGGHGVSKRLVSWELEAPARCWQMAFDNNSPWGARDWKEP